MWMILLGKAGGGGKKYVCDLANHSRFPPLFFSVVTVFLYLNVQRWSIAQEREYSTFFKSPSKYFRRKLLIFLCPIIAQNQCQTCKMAGTAIYKWNGRRTVKWPASEAGRSILALSLSQRHSWCSSCCTFHKGNLAEWIICSCPHLSHNTPFAVFLF